jgi:hypothetical protein
MTMEKNGIPLEDQPTTEHPPLSVNVSVDEKQMVCIKFGFPISGLQFNAAAASDFAAILVRAIAMALAPKPLIDAPPAGIAGADGKPL